MSKSPIVSEFRVLYRRIFWSWTRNSYFLLNIASVYVFFPSSAASTSYLSLNYQIPYTYWLGCSNSPILCHQNKVQQMGFLIAEMIDKAKLSWSYWMSPMHVHILSIRFLNRIERYAYKYLYNTSSGSFKSHSLAHSFTDRIKFLTRRSSFT